MHMPAAPWRQQDSQAPSGTVNFIQDFSMQTTKYLVRKYACAKTLFGVLGLFCLPALNAAPLHAADTNDRDRKSVV